MSIHLLSSPLSDSGGASCAGDSVLAAHPCHSCQSHSGDRENVQAEIHSAGRTSSQACSEDFEHATALRYLPAVVQESSHAGLASHVMLCASHTTMQHTLAQTVIVVMSLQPALVENVSHGAAYLASHNHPVHAQNGTEVCNLGSITTSACYPCRMLVKILQIEQCLRHFSLYHL